MFPHNFPVDREVNNCQIVTDLLRTCYRLVADLLWTCYRLVVYVVDLLQTCGLVVDFLGESRQLVTGKVVQWILAFRRLNV